MDHEMRPAREIAFSILTTNDFIVPWLFEHTPASSEPIDESYLRHVREADMVVWLIGTDTTRPVRNEIREALAANRPLLCFRLPVPVIARETESLLAEVRPRAKWDLVTLQDLAESLRLAISGLIARAVRGKPGLGRLALLDAQERRSRARCIRRFLAAGVPQAGAETLAADLVVGFRPDIADPASRRVTILQADLGAGKSLALDRSFAGAVCALRDDSSSPVPVFLEAREVSGSLRSDVEQATLGLGDPRTQGVRLFIDGADEVPLGTGELIAEQARELAFEWPASSVVIATRHSGLFRRPEETIELPPLEEDQVVDLVLRVFPLARGIRAGLLRSPSLREALRRPLFALLFAAHQSARPGGEVATKADLIRGLVEGALGHRGSPAPQLEETLARLAVRSLDQDGPVAISEIGTRAEIQALLESRLVVPDQADTLRFSLRILTEWFGAIALGRGVVDTGQLVREPQRLERWRSAIAVSLNSFNHSDVSRVFRPIVVADPGFASEIVKDAMPRYSEEAGPTPDPFDAGLRIRETMAAWLEGLEPIAKRFSVASVDARLTPLGISVDAGGRVTTSWCRAGSARPDVFLLPEGSAFFNDFGSFESAGWSRSSRPPRQSAWAWRWSHDDVIHELDRLVKSRALTAGCATYTVEAFWQAVVTILGRGSLFRQHVLIEQFETKLRSLSDTVRWVNSLPVDPPALRREVEALKGAGKSVIIPPWPGPDSPGSGGSWIWSGFSPSAVLELTRGVYKGALEIYEELVSSWLPLCAKRLKTAALLPAHLRGRLVVREARDPQDHNPPVLHLLIEPLSRASRTMIDFELSDSGFSREDYESARNDFRQIRGKTHPWLPFSYRWESLTGLFGMTPATDLAYSWLDEELRSLSLIE